MRDFNTSIAHTKFCERIGEALVVGFSKCEIEGRPLTELQRIDMTTAVVQTVDGLRAELEADYAVDRLLRARPLHPDDLRRLVGDAYPDGASQLDLSDDWTERR